MKQIWWALFFLILLVIASAAWADSEMAGPRAAQSASSNLARAGHAWEIQAP